MSIILIAIAAISLLVAVIASAVAIAKPYHRVVAIVVAVCGFSVAAGIVGLVAFAIRRMN